MDEEFKTWLTDLLREAKAVLFDSMTASVPDEMLETVLDITEKQFGSPVGVIDVADLLQSIPLPLVAPFWREIGALLKEHDVKPVFLADVEQLPLLQAIQAVAAYCGTIAVSTVAGADELHTFSSKHIYGEEEEGAALFRSPNHKGPLA